MPSAEKLHARIFYFVLGMGGHNVRCRNFVNAPTSISLLGMCTGAYANDTVNGSRHIGILKELC